MSTADNAAEPEPAAKVKEAVSESKGEMKMPVANGFNISVLMIKLIVVFLSVILASSGPTLPINWKAPRGSNTAKEASTSNAFLG